MAKKNVIEIMLAKFPIFFSVQNLAVSGKVRIFAPVPVLVNTID